MSHLKRSRTELTLQRKIEVIKGSDTGKSQRQLAYEFDVGKTQVQVILKRNSELQQAHEENGKSSRKRVCYHGGQAKN